MLENWPPMAQFFLNTVIPSAFDREAQDDMVARDMVSVSCHMLGRGLPEYSRFLFPALPQRPIDIQNFIIDA